MCEPVKRPESLDALDLYSATVTIAHEAVFGLHRELIGLGAADEHTRALLQESATLSQHRMPTLTRQLRALGAEWERQELLEPVAAARTIERFEEVLARVRPQIVALRIRQGQIAAELCDLLSRAR